MASIAEKIYQFNAGRLPDMIQRKYALMSENPFSFFRATSHLFYDDLVNGFIFNNSIKVWSCGDLHVQNFGTFRAENRLVYFDLNDFDDGALLPPIFDLARMAVSIYLASENQKWDTATAKSLVFTFLNTYKEVLQKGKVIDIDHRTTETEQISLIKKLEKRETPKFVKSFLDKNEKNLRTDSKKLLPVDEKRYKSIEEHVDAYFSKHHSSFFRRIKDIRFRVAGTASLGLERYILLIETEKSMDEKYLLLDLKEARPSAVLPFLNIPQPTWNNEAERITAVQNYVNDVLPALFNPITFSDKSSFVMREMQAEEDKFDVLSPIKLAKFQAILTEMGSITASGHLRSAGRKGSSIIDELIDFAHQKDLLEPIEKYAKNYIKKVHSDFDEFSKSIKSTTPLSIKSNLD